MKKLEIPYETDLRTATLTEGSVIRINNDPEFVINAFYNEEEGRLVRFWTAKRNGEEIREFHHSINKETGTPHLDFVGVYKKDQQSKIYFELNAILQKFEK